MSKYKDIQEKSDSDLVELVAHKRDAVRKFRFNTAGASTRDVRAIRRDKKEIAQALTELTARAKKADKKE